MDYPEILKWILKSNKNKMKRRIKKKEKRRDHYGVPSNCWCIWITVKFIVNQKATASVD